MRLLPFSRGSASLSLVTFLLATALPARADSELEFLTEDWSNVTDGEVFNISWTGSHDRVWLTLLPNREHISFALDTKGPPDSIYTIPWIPYGENKTYENYFFLVQMQDGRGQNILSERFRILANNRTDRPPSRYQRVTKVYTSLPQTETQTPSSTATATTTTTSIPLATATEVNSNDTATSTFANYNMPDRSSGLLSAPFMCLLVLGIVICGCTVALIAATFAGSRSEARREKAGETASSPEGESRETNANDGESDCCSLEKGLEVEGMEGTTRHVE